MNSQLYGKTYKIPDQILTSIRQRLYTATDDGSEGIKRGKNLLKNGTVTYQNLKRLKNYFDYTDPKSNPIEYELAGGVPMRQFVETTLSSERAGASSTSQTNAVFMPTPATDKSVNIQKSPNMNIVNENVDTVKRGAIAVIINPEDKVLIMKRAMANKWGAGKWALVGGKIEKGEEPIDAVRREIKEEAGLDIDYFVESFIIKNNSETVEHMFIANAPENAEVVLNEEHDEFKWVDIKEISKMDCVPSLLEYITMALTKNDE